MKYEGQRYAVETLVTDTVSYDVIHATEKTITIRRRGMDPHQASYPAPGYDQGPYPVLLYPTRSEPVIGKVQRVRLRKDGTYRTGPGMNPLRFTNTEPTHRVDYRM